MFRIGDTAYYIVNNTIIEGEIKSVDLIDNAIVYNVFSYNEGLTILPPQLLYKTFIEAKVVIND